MVAGAWAIVREGEGGRRVARGLVRTRAVRWRGGWAGEARRPVRRAVPSFPGGVSGGVEGVEGR